MTDLKKKPNTSSAFTNNELEKAEKQFESFEKNVNELTLDRMNQAKTQELEPQTKLSSSEIEKSKEVYLKPIRRLGSKEKFNENYRNDYNFSSENVRFIAENKEIIGETIEVWTKPFAGMPAEFWKVPVNIPVWAPRYVAERIARCEYHRLRMEEGSLSQGDERGNKYFGSMVVDSKIKRLDAIPVSTRKSIFMGASGF